MQINVIVMAALLAFGFVIPASGSPRPQSVSPAQETGSVRLDAPARAVAPATPTRGQLLYENHCMSCHESVVHIRSKRHARSAAELRVRVTRWAAVARVRWGMEEIDDVTRYLDSQYYKFESR